MKKHNKIIYLIIINIILIMLNINVYAKIDDKRRINIINIVNEINDIPNSYNREPIKRMSGYNYFVNNIESNNYYFDCSSFVATVMYKLDSLRLINDNGSVYTTISFLKDAKAKKNFIITKYTNYNKIDIGKLKIGDLILGIDNKDEYNNHTGINHIMVYIGDNYVAHSTRGYKNGDSNLEYRNGIVIEKLDSDYYLKVGLSNKYRFNKKIYVIRKK